MKEFLGKPKNSKDKHLLKFLPMLMERDNQQVALMMNPTKHITYKSDPSYCLTIDNIPSYGEYM